MPKNGSLPTTVLAKNKHANEQAMQRSNKKKPQIITKDVIFKMVQFNRKLVTVTEEGKEGKARLRCRES